jgi:hypothetical protein
MSSDNSMVRLNQLHASFGGSMAPGANGDATEAAVAAVAAAASAAAAAAAAAVVAAAGQQVQQHLQVHPPAGFPFFGMPPSVLAQLSAAAGAPTPSALGLRADLLAAAGAGHAAVAGGNGPNSRPSRADRDGLDRVKEATGTTDATSISGSAEARGSDGDR